MALPTQEIEKIVRGPAAAQGTYKQLLLLSGSLLTISLILYFGMLLGYEPYLKNQISSLDSQIQEFAKKTPVAQQTELINFYSQLTNLKTLLSKHPSTLNLFTWLQKNSQANTYFTKFSFNGTTYQLALAGTSRTTEDAAAQMAIFESQPEVSRMNFNNLSADPAGGWQFNLTIFIDPKALDVSGVVPPAPVAPAPASTSTQSGAATTTQPIPPASTSTKP